MGVISFVDEQANKTVDSTGERERGYITVGCGGRGRGGERERRVRVWGEREGSKKREGYISQQ